jgi:hypothetical protein
MLKREVRGQRLLLKSQNGKLNNNKLNNNKSKNQKNQIIINNLLLLKKVGFIYLKNYK